MKNNILGFCLSSLLLIFSMVQVSKAQYVLKDADEQYKLFNYVKAIDLYEQAYKKRPSLYAAERLANCYQMIQNYKETESWAAIAMNTKGSNPEDILIYAKALQNNSKYSEAKAQYEKYADINKEITPAQKSVWILSCDSAMLWMKTPKSIIIQNQKNLNTPQSDWGAVKIGKDVIFASDRGVKTDGESQSGEKPFLKFDGSKKPDTKIYGWTGNQYLRLYSQSEAEDKFKEFPIEAGTEYHVGPASFTTDGNEMFFTLTRIPSKPKFVNGKLATINFEVFSSKKAEDGKWSVPVPFSYNKVDLYSIGDPYISKDGKALYFASDMPGGMGGSDLYYCPRLDNGEWGRPIPLKELNTKGNERSPFFDSNNTFYFSSDGMIGMGGLDIFSYTPSSSVKMPPVNMGYPTNSPQDDFAYTQSGPLDGYLSSNRTEGLGEDDIYRFTLQEIIAFKLSGRVYNKTTGEPLGGAIVSLNRTGGSTLKVETDETGAFKFNLLKNSDFGLTGEKTSFRNDGTTLSTMGLIVSTEIKKDLYLEPIIKDKEIRIENIYYDFDKSNIRADAAIELDKLVKILQDNPTIWIELGSHTDSRGNDAYNLALSQRRADSAVQYIISRGINKNRITAQGYGETKLLNKCSNGVKCTPEEHQLNRRTEFKITKM